MIARWEQMCRKLTALAEEIPANKFEYRPTEGVRTFDEVLRHVAFWNGYVADLALGKKGDDTANEMPKDRCSTKAQVIDALKTSAARALVALKKNPSGLSLQTAETVVTFIEHNSEHYGQLVVYARLNEIVPPASRG
ncbi:MAG TPA: DinB family protein [Terriglobales bacterium]|nr:DinB family protein [Terriglobales bacterium]